MSKNRERNTYIDVVKAMAIILVVLGHSLQFTLSDSQRFSNTLFIMIYSFHMPLFIGISGYLFANQSRKYSTCEIIRNKLRTIGIPALTFSLLIIFMQLAIAAIKGQFSLDTFITCFVNHFFKGVWFLWALLAISIIYSVIVKHNKRVVAIFTALTIPLSFVVPNLSILNWCLYLTPFFGIGYLLNTYNVPNNISNHIIPLTIVAIAVWGCTLPFMHNKEALIYNTGTYILGTDALVQLFRDIIRIISGLAGTSLLLSILWIVRCKLQCFRVVGGVKISVSRR